jgi:tetratricopeptide (TPR) repeat protein
MRGAFPPSAASGVRGAKGRRVAAGLIALSVLSFGALASQRAAATTAGFWERVATSPRVEADRLLTEAEGLLAADPRRPGAGTPGARAEALVRRALALVPDDFRALAALAEIDDRAGRAAAALAGLERACPRAPNVGVAAACWFRLGIEQSRRGRFAEAVAAYEQRLALAAGDVTVLVNLGEALMGLGRLDDAEARYREALRLETPVAGHLEDRHGLLLATYGLAVVLDRAAEPVAAREMMARALALDPRASQLEAAREPGGDVFFVPEGDVFYYLGLAFEVAERIDDAEAAFQEFCERLPKSPWLGRARAHIAALEVVGRGDARVSRARPLLHVTAAGTVSAKGPIPAPLVDAAWRQRPGLLDDCFEEATRGGLVAARQGFRFALELDLDATGAVTRVVVQAPPPLDELATGPFARCVDAALRAGLRVSRPRTAKPTHARVELLVGGRE